MSNHTMVRTRELLVEQVAPATTAGKPAAKRRRRRRRPRRRNAATTRVGAVQNFPGVVDFRVDKTSAIGNVLSKAGLTTLDEASREWVHRHCNPCGEAVTSTYNSRVPDGALPSSCAIGLRQALIVRCPGLSNSSIPIDSGDMWTLTILHLPAFRTPLILVANLDNAEMSAGDRLQLIQKWNSTETKPVYPEWESLQATSYWTTVEWSGLRNVDPPTENGTRTVQQFRITADGMTVFNNTPDLINQGMVIGAQWSTNVSVKTEEQNVDNLGYSGNLTLVQHNSVSNFQALTIRLPFIPGSYLSVTDPVNCRIDYPTSSSGPWNIARVVLTVSADTAASVEFRLKTSHDFSFTGSIDGSTATSFTGTRNQIWQFKATWVPNNPTGTTGSWALVTSVVGTAVTEVFSFAAGTRGERVQGRMSILDNLEMPTVTIFQLPPTDTENIIQSTDKAVYMSAKEENGIYMVKRVFQPVFNVQEAAARRQVVFTDAEVLDRGFEFSPQDVFDLNYGVGTVVWNSIPKACAPAIKLVRDLEIVPGADSTYMPFVEPGRDPCEAALAIAHSMAQHHPFMYPESYNILGGLMGLISKTVGSIPVLGNVVRAVPSIIKAITSKEQEAAPPSGASQNRLTSTNVDELAKLVAMLLQQLRL